MKRNSNDLYKNHRRSSIQTPTRSPLGLKRSSVYISEQLKPDLETTILILQKNPVKRNSREIEALYLGTINTKFFENSDELYGQGTHQECCKKMYYKNIKKDDILFESGSMGNEFFVILKGSVGVFVWLNISEKNHEERKKNEYYSKFIDVLYPPNNGKCLTEVKIMNIGEHFGELALLGGKNTPRAATIIAKEECHFCVLERKDFRNILKEKEEERINNNIFFLKNIVFLKDLDMIQLQNIYYLCDQKKVSYNQIIYKQGDDSNFFYIIKKGDFLVSKTITMDEKEIKISKEISLGILNNNEFFGEIELLDHSKRQYTITCKEQNAELYRFDKKNFFRKIISEPSCKAYLNFHIVRKQEYFRTLQLKFIETINEKTKKDFFNKKKQKLDESKSCLQQIDSSSSLINIYFNEPFFNTQRKSLYFANSTFLNDDDKLKDIHSNSDYKSFLNKKLQGYIKFDTHRKNIEKKNKEIYKTLFDYNLEKTNTKKLMDIRIKNIADIIKNKQKKEFFVKKDRNVKENFNSLQKDSKTKSIILDDYIKNQENKLGELRKKINYIFEKTFNHSNLTHRSNYLDRVELRKKSENY